MCIFIIYMILCIYLNKSQKTLYNMHEYVWHLNNAFANKEDRK